MTNQDQQKIVQSTIDEFFQKMTIPPVTVTLRSSPKKANQEENTFEVLVSIAEPQVLIGQNGQTLLEVERLLKIILAKRCSQHVSINLDINGYKKKKEEYLKTLAKETADEVAFIKERRVLPPMPAFQRRVIHIELSQRQDVKTESQGIGEDRCVAIIPQ